MDRVPTARVRLLFGAMCLAVTVIGVRLYHVQSSLGEDYLAEVERLVERIESIPSRDARILAADGTVLAADSELYALKVHYRWLEDPVDPEWLKQSAVAKLSRVERKSKDRVLREAELVLRRREQFWLSVADTTGLSIAELTARRRDVQRRVESRRDAVLRRQAEKRREEESDADDSVARSSAEPRDWAGGVGSWWSVVTTTLTTPPRRDESNNRLVLEEELEYHPIVEELARDQALAVESRPDRFPGARVEITTRRVYPEGALAPHVIGYRTELTGEETVARRAKLAGGDPLDYRDGDRVGRAGIERSYDGLLRGLRGERRIFLNRRGEIVRTEVVREPRSGRDIVLTLDLALQRAAEGLLDEVLTTSSESAGAAKTVPTGGAIIAIEVGTGRVLTLASGPRFDVSRISTDSGSAWAEWLADGRKPLFHRAIEMAQPPGSVFKVVSAMAGLECGALVADEPFPCRGYLDSPDQLRCLVFKNHRVGHGDVTLIDALARSCNVYFFDMARRAGPAPIVAWARRLGYGAATGIDLPGEAVGNLPAARGGARPSGETLGLAIGQARLTATPLQVATMMAAVASDGRSPPPRVAEGGDYNSPAEFAIPESATASERTSLAWVRRGLEAVVAHPQGTGYKSVRTPEVRIAGKTGTAETGGHRPDHAWFAGYVPADRPRVAFVVMLEHAGSGGQVAGPVAREFVHAMLRAGLLDDSASGEPSAPLAD
jgi:penicillin-binding protein 2